MDKDRRIFELQAELCQVLAHPRRLEILYTLERGELSTGDLSRELGVSLPNVSQHLAIMRGQGLLEARKEGQNVYYRIALPEVIAACNMVRQALLERMQRQSSTLRGAGVG